LPSVNHISKITVENFDAPTTLQDMLPDLLDEFTEAQQIAEDDILLPTIIDETEIDSLLFYRGIHSFRTFVAPTL
jgi:hypothetical protein